MDECGKLPGANTVNQACQLNICHGPAKTRVPIQYKDHLSRV